MRNIQYEILFHVTHWEAETVCFKQNHVLLDYAFSSQICDSRNSSYYKGEVSTDIFFFLHF